MPEEDLPGTELQAIVSCKHECWQPNPGSTPEQDVVLSCLSNLELLVVLLRPPPKN